MSSSMLKGKTKSDLIEIAHLSGILTTKETNRMTKAQILEVLENANQAHQDQQEAEEKEKQEPKPKSSDTKKRQATKKTSTKKTGSAAKTTKQDNSDESKQMELADLEEKSEAKDDETLEDKTESKTTRTTSTQKRTSKTQKKEESESKEDTDKSTKDKESKPKSRTKKSKATEKKIIDLTGNETDKDKSESEQSDSQNSQDNNEKQEEQEIVQGILEIMPDNYGFLRVENYLQSNRDFYVPPQFIRRFNLRNGDKIEGPAKLQKDSEKYRAISYINLVNDLPPEQMNRRPQFDRLTPIYPDEKYKLETHQKELATRMIDLISPIGKGQRGMIVSPPKAGKTVLLKKIANAISINNPDSKLFVLLIDERPEEVTDMQRSIDGEVVYSTFDKTPENHVKVTELVLERAMRLVELNHDVVILLDSITRMSRAYNLTINPTGRTLSGGLDPGALHGPKRFFGAARNIENGGSLTIIATALIDTGSRMDEVIFEEFKGTGNMEVVLDRKLAEKRVFPAIDLNKSSTRREDLLMSKEELNTVWAMRKAFSGSETLSVTETMINLLLKTKSNDQFANSISISLKDQDLFEAMRGSPVPASNSNNVNGVDNKVNGNR
ncbi:MAG: transcription termination factor Rho [Clostridiaceae bacterium]|nr:transcription termination factor Rho [Clostridiaceae bacterium]